MPDILSVADHADMIVNGYAFLRKKFPYFIQFEAFVWHFHKGKFISSKDYSENTPHVVYEIGIEKIHTPACTRRREASKH